MSESENTGDNGQAQDADRAQVQFRIERVFLKDSSFESRSSQTD